LIFISLAKVKNKPTKEATGKFTKTLGELKKKGINILGLYWTLGRYDGVMIFEAPSEKDAMKLAVDLRDGMTAETMVAIPREEAIKLV
jgi:uncharacterized protein with GYD domain